MPVSVTTATTNTYTNGTANDGSQVKQDFDNAFASLSAVKAKVDTLLLGNLEESTTLLLNSTYTGSSPGNMFLSVERGTLANTGFKWLEASTAWQVSNDGTNYYSLLTTNSAATQSDLETATSLTTVVTPGRQQYHPSAAKAWVRFNGSGTIAIVSSYGVTSLTDNGVGTWDVNWTTAFSATTSYTTVGNTGTTGAASYQGLLNLDQHTTAKVNVRAYNATPAASDATVVQVVAFGDQ